MVVGWVRMQGVGGGMGKDCGWNANITKISTL